MPTDLEVLTRAYLMEQKSPKHREWLAWAVGATPKLLQRMAEEQMVIAVWGRGQKTAWALSEKGRGLVATFLSEREVNAIPLDDIMDAFMIIKGWDDLKAEVAKVVHEQKRVHFLFSGPPACAKSLILSGVEKAAGPERCYMAFGSRTSAAGLSQELFQNHPQVLCLDELDKMDIRAFSVLLGLMESGDLIETKSGNRRGITLNTVVLAAANDTRKLPAELLSRFFHAQFPPYSRQEFLEVAEHFLGMTTTCPPLLAREMGALVYDRQLGDIRKLRDIWQLMGEATREEMLAKVDLLDRYTPKKQRTQMPAGRMLL